VTRLRAALLDAARQTAGAERGVGQSSRRTGEGAGCGIAVAEPMPSVDFVPPKRPYRGEGNAYSTPGSAAGGARPELATFIYRAPSPRRRRGRPTLLGVDDTDSLRGGCTTHVAAQLALQLRARLGLVLLDHPRLVRLNPANPWKTRGNAALALRLGRARGPPQIIGMWAGRPVEAFPSGRDVAPSEEVLEAAWSIVEPLTWQDDDRTNPGVVLAARPGPGRWYEGAMHELLDVAPVERRIRRAGLLARAAGTRRGLIGASAAVSWLGDPHTWELLAYRREGAWGTPRDIDPGSVLAMQRAFPTTHDSYDEGNRSATMVPSSPCPVLFGIRGTEPADLPAALAMVGPERPEGWLVLRTNQGTDDHLVPEQLREARPNEGVAVAGTVAVGPRTIEGGHVLLTLREGRARLDIAAYEPTKGFRDIVRMLRPGDRVVACGSVRDGPRTVNLEKLRVVALGAPVERVKVANPKCPRCGKGMKSVGKGAGYRCARCGTKAGPASASFEDRPRGLGPGWYEVPTCARRHLARPLKLGVRPELDALS